MHARYMDRNEKKKENPKSSATLPDESHRVETHARKREVVYFAPRESEELKGYSCQCHLGYHESGRTVGNREFFFPTLPYSRERQKQSALFCILSIPSHFIVISMSICS